ncbi:histone H3-K9 methyltransferase [Trema orientale]|uniref:Histone H3-K9 methyltransferase n=1 Tax=Trema orientale TaxID=63057 RepID=A0A2P5EPG9_TREOI|nr:histone H3-K9 methyltransferase [Trema orientale]
MKVKGGGRRKSWEAEAVAVAMSGSIADENLGGDSLTNPPNGSFSAAPSIDAHQTLHDAQPQAEADAHDADEDDDGDDADVADDNAQRPKLDEGFYEIEAIRRKRVRKGQLQYLIKWRGWPETANTWEPLENLQSCSDVIEAFEESLQSGKTRKRKRKHGTPHTQPKKRQQRSTVPDTGLETINADKPLSTHALENLSLADISALPQQGYNGDFNNSETTKKVSVENGHVNEFPKNSVRKDRNEYDPKLSELKTTSTSNGDKVGIQFQEAKALEGNGPTNGIANVNCMETVQSNRSTGAKRRKPASVKRFKQEPHLCETAVMQNITIGTSIVSSSRIGLLGTGNPNVAGENRSHTNKTDESENVLPITKIIKPIGYSASVTNNVQDVAVTFMAMRSDGREMMVDNKFLKAHNPLLLINFYEQHLRYTATL